MHPAAVGYVLLLAGLITLALLLPRGCGRNKNKSPFYALSISDILSTVLTAVALLATHGETGIGLSYNWRNDTRGATNRTWTEENALPFSRNRHRRTANDSITDLNVTVTCDMEDVLMQYGMLLGALANAFVSVLTFAVQCDLSVARMKKTRCADATKFPAAGARRGEGKQAARKERASCEQPSAFQQTDATGDSGGIRKKLFEFRLSRNGDQRSMTRFFVASHWLVPVLVVAILYGAEYDDTSVIRRAEDIECVFSGNFPMTDFHTFSVVDVDTTSVASADGNSLVDDHSSTARSSEVDEIVSRVRDIVRLALNYTGDSAENSGLLGTVSGSNYSADVRDPISNKTVHFDQEMFRDLLRNMSMDGTAFTSPGRHAPSVETESDREDPQIHFADEGATEGIVDIFVGQNGTLIPDNRTYDDILKRLRAANAVKRRENWVDRVTNRRQVPTTEDLVFGERNTLRQYLDAVARNGTLHIANRCFVSINFLRLHLLVLLFAIYFTSILISCVSQVRGRRACKEILANTTTDDPTSDPPEGSVDSNDECATTVAGKSRSESRLSARDKRSCHEEDSTERSDASHEPGDRHSSDTQVIMSKEGRARAREPRNFATSEIARLMRASNNVRLSLILCVILWTPMFLEILLKVLACGRTPQWLTDIAFSCALFFSILRHAVNVSIVKSQEVRGNVKENRIHPSK